MAFRKTKVNETIYLIRDVLTGRILNAEHVTESTKERLKQLLAPVVALEVPVIGVISDAQPTELQVVAELWPNIPHQICQFRAKRARRESDLQCRPSGEDPYAHQHAEKNARLSSRSPQTSAAYQEWWQQQPDGEAQLHARLGQ